MIRGAPAAAIAALLCACGAAGPAAEAPPPAARAPLPATDRDPLPHAPPPTELALAGGPVALAASGGEDQARRMLPSLVEALREGSERRLSALFAEEVGYLARQTSVPQPRGALVLRLMTHLRRGAIPADAETADLFDLDAVRVVRASAFFEDRELPPLLLPTDLVLEAPLREAGRVPLRTLFNWGTAVGRIAVRPGRDPAIVAY